MKIAKVCQFIATGTLETHMGMDPKVFGEGGRGMLLDWLSYTATGDLGPNSVFEGVACLGTLAVSLTD